MLVLLFHQFNNCVWSNVPETTSDEDVFASLGFKEAVFYFFPIDYQMNVTHSTSHNLVKYQNRMQETVAFSREIGRAMLSCILNFNHKLVVFRVIKHPNPSTFASIRLLYRLGPIFDCKVFRIDPHCFQVLLSKPLIVNESIVN